MSAIDIIILAVFAVSAVIGFSKGAVRQIGSAAGAIVGFLAARVAGNPVGIALFGEAKPEDSSFTPVMVEIMGCIVVFLAVWLVAFLLSKLLKGLVSAVGLGIFDRLGGAAIMVVKWFLAVSIVLNVWYFFDPSNSMFTGSTLLDGRVMREVMELFPWLMGLAGIN